MDMQKIWSKVRRLEDVKEEGGIGYTEPPKLLIPKGPVEFMETDAGGMAILDHKIGLVIGAVYEITLFAENGTPVTLVTGSAYQHELGVKADIDSNPELGLCDFSPEIAEEMGAPATIMLPSAGTFTVSVRTTETIHPIDPKFLPEGVATKADILGAMEASY